MAMRYLWLLLLAACTLPATAAGPRIEVLNYKTTDRMVEFDLVNRSDAAIAVVGVFFRGCWSGITRVSTVGRPLYLAVDARMDPLWEGSRLIAPGETRHMAQRGSGCKPKLDRVSAAFTDGTIEGDPRDFERCFHLLQVRRVVAERWLAAARNLPAEAEPAKAVEELIAGVQKEYAEVTAHPLGPNFSSSQSLRSALPKWAVWPGPRSEGITPAYSDDSDRIRGLLEERNGTAARKRQIASSLSDLMYLLRPFYDRLAPIDAPPSKQGEWRFEPEHRAAVPRQEAGELIGREIAWLEKENQSLSWLDQFVH